MAHHRTDRCLVRAIAATIVVLSLAACASSEGGGGGDTGGASDGAEQAGGACPDELGEASSGAPDGTDAPVAWTQELDFSPIVNQIVDDVVVVSGSIDGIDTTAAFDLTTGEGLWCRVVNLQDAFSHPIYRPSQPGVGPVLAQRDLESGFDLVGIDPRSGEILWETGDDQPFVVGAGEAMALVTGLTNGGAAYTMIDTGSGTTLWEADPEYDTTGCIAGAVAAIGGGTLEAAETLGLATSDGSERWGAAGAHPRNCFEAEGYVVLSTDPGIALAEIESGNVVLDLPGGGDLFALTSDQALVFDADAQTIAAFALDGSSEATWEMALGSNAGVDDSVFVVDDQLAIAGSGDLALRDAVTGAEIWTVDIGLESGAPPTVEAISGGTVIVSYDDRLDGFSVEDGSEQWTLQGTGAFDLETSGDVVVAPDYRSGANTLTALLVGER